MDSVSARVSPAPAVAAIQPVVSTQPVTPVDPQAPRASAPPVNADAANAARTKAEPARSAGVGSGGAVVQVLPALVAAPTNRAVSVAPQLTQLLQLLQALGVADSGEGAPPVVNWPQAGQPVAEEPASALMRLREALGLSTLFAANPRTPAVLAALAQSPGGAAFAPLAPGAQTPEAAQAPAVAQPPAPSATLAPAASGLAAFGAAETVEALPLAPPGDLLARVAGEIAALASPWPAALAVERAQQALQLLLHGQLQWRGELTPGVPLRLEREDVWEEDPAQPGVLLPGTALRLELLLPATGALVVLAQQIGGKMTVRLLPAAPHAERFEAALGDLQTALAPLADPPVDLALQPRATGPT